MHAWEGYEARIASPFAAIRDHVLLARATDIAAADSTYGPLITSELIDYVTGLVPTSWWPLGQRWQHPEQVRDAMRHYLIARITGPRAFVVEGERAHAALL